MDSKGQVTPVPPELGVRGLHRQYTPSPGDHYNRPTQSALKMNTIASKKIDSPEKFYDRLCPPAHPGHNT
jgi:hypothetical protein